MMVISNYTGPMCSTVIGDNYLEKFMNVPQTVHQAAEQCDTFHRNI